MSDIDQPNPSKPASNEALKSEAPSEASKAPVEGAGIESEPEMTTEEMLGWGEFMAWNMLVMTPILWWFNGPSVSDDQFYVRSGLIVLSGTAAVVLRIINRRIKRASTTVGMEGGGDCDKK